MDSILWIFVGFASLCLNIKVTVSDSIVCSDYLVSGLFGVEDSALTASSSYPGDMNHEPQNARLYFDGGIFATSTSSAWSAASNNVHEYIQVQFQRETQIDTIMVQGRKDTGPFQFVKTYYVLYSIDGVTWTTVTSHNHAPTLFTGNTDRNTIVRSSLVPSITAVYLRINPRSWSEFISLRFDAGGCYIDGTVSESHSEHYQRLPMLPSTHIEQNKVLELKSQSVPKCGTLCHQTDTCRVFTLDENKICRGFTSEVTNQYAANSKILFFANKGILTPNGFQTIQNSLALYRVNERSLDQKGAADLCAKHYTQLKKIMSLSEMSSLQNVIAGNTVLLQDHQQLFVSGMYSSPQWKYSDGKEVIGSALWSPGNPNPNRGHCVMMTQTGLSSVGCTESLFSICEPF